MRRTSLLLILGILVVVFTGLYTGYLFWQKSASEAELKKVEKNLSEYESKMLQYESQKVLEAITAKRTLDELKADTIEWSKIIKKIRKTIPKKKGTALVDVLSYSGSSRNEIAMNVKTYPEGDEPYFDVADLIEAFDESQFFVENFVPSISSGVDEEGREILTFLFNTKYVEENPLEFLEQDEEEEEEAPAIERESDESEEEEDLEGAIEDVLGEALERDSEKEPADADSVR